MTKAHTFWTLFQGAGAPPSPWNAESAGGASAPFQENGSLRFPGVGVGGSDSDIYANVDLDLTDDAVFLQFESLLGQASTIEFDLLFSSGWAVTMQLKGLFFNLYITHGASVPFSHENIDAGSLDPLCWQISYAHDQTTIFQAGPTPWEMRVLDFSSAAALPPTNAAAMNSIQVYSKNESAFTITYGETRLIGFDAWYPPARSAVFGVGGARTSYTLGTPVTGLSGSGDVAVPGLYGVLVTLTSVPAGWGHGYESPLHYIPSVGSVQFSDLNGDTDLYRVHEPTQLIFSPNGTNELVRYSFHPDVVATITPLL